MNDPQLVAPGHAENFIVIFYSFKTIRWVARLQMGEFVTMIGSGAKQ